jgi:hypothetical protein
VVDERKIMNKNNEPNPPAEPAYSAPMSQPVEPEEQKFVLPEEPEEHNDETFDEEVGTSEDVEADFDTEETNAKEEA